MKKLNYIALVSVSVIIGEGLQAILNKTKFNIKIFFFNDSQELENYANKSVLNLIIINSDISEDDIKTIQKINIPNLKIIGLISNSPNRTFYSLIDNKIYLNDNPSKIIEIIETCLSNSNKSKEKFSKNNLSKRETEILKLLVIGKSNKEIANILYVSIHTVISHRKNITSKLGIKSTAAMAIFAVANNLIDINEDIDLI